MYQDLGPRGPLLGVSDKNQQINPFLLGTGWDVIFDATLYFSNLTGLELYHIALDGPVGSRVAVNVGYNRWSYAAGWANEWDPGVPTPLGQQGVIQFCWNVPFQNPPYDHIQNIQPTVTLWLREFTPGLV